MTTIRVIGFRRNSPRQLALLALAEAGGSMEYDEFRRVLGKLCPSKGAVSYALSQMRSKRFTQHRVHLTASGSARLARTAP